MMVGSDSRPRYLEGQTQRIATVTPNRGLALFSKAVVVLTFILICAGALVTGNKAALSDPTWPEFVGKWFPTKATFVANLRFEDSHRVIAGITAITAFVLAIVLTYKEKRQWVRRLGWFAVGTVIAQAVLGGLIIRLFRQYNMSVFHACLGQAFFCLIVSIAVFTSKRWERDKLSIERPGNVSFYRQCKWAVGLIFFQLLLGAALRHSERAFWIHLYLHMGTAVLVVGMVIWLTTRVFAEYKDIARLRRTSIFLSIIVVIQIVLGVLSIFANRARVAPETPRFDHVVVSTAHVATGALILATTLILAIRARQALQLPGKTVNEAFAAEAAS
jgi:cytochrome c oxidase assembly protein subunit 15